MNPDHEHDLSILDEMLATEDAGFTAWEINFLESLDRLRGSPTFGDVKSWTLKKIYKERMP